MSAATLGRTRRVGRAALGLVIASLGWAAPHDAGAQASHAGFPVTDGPVRSLALAGDTLFVAGDFTRIGTPTGGPALVTDAVTGVAVTTFAVTDGAIEAIAADGAGGWFVGGSFTHIGGWARAHLAHVTAGGVVDAWDPGTNATVRAIATKGATVYVGGDFTQAGGQWRQHLAGIDAVTGVPTEWNAGTLGPVYALLCDNARLLVGGQFTGAGPYNDMAGPWLPTYATRHNIVAFDALSGDVQQWSADVNGCVRCAALSDGVYFLGGDFTAVNGVTRNRLAAVSETGVLVSWNGTADGTVRALAAVRGKVYVGGDFSHVGGKPRRYLAALSTLWWQALEWGPAPDGPVNAIAVSGATVYAAGAFRSLSGVPRSRAAALDTTTGSLRAWQPVVNGEVRALAVSPARVAIAGAFTCADVVARPGLAAIDRRTEAVLPWVPDVVGPVRSIVRSGDRLVVSGAGSSGTVMIDARSGARVAWGPYPGDCLVAADDARVYLADPAVADSAAVDAVGAGGGDAVWHHTARRTAGSCQIEAILATPGGLFIGGRFDRLPDAFECWNLGFFYGEAGVLRHAYDAIADVSALAVCGSRVYVAGDGLRAVDATDGFPIDWSSPLTDIGAAAATPRRLYVAGRGGSLRAADAGTGATLDWRVDGDGAAYALAEADGVVYAGGAFTSLGGQLRGGLAALDGAPTPLTVAPPAAGEAGAPSVAPNPVTDVATVRFDLPAAATVTIDLVDLMGRRVARVSDHRSFGPGRRELTLMRGALAPGLYWLRFAVGQRVTSSRVVLVR